MKSYVKVSVCFANVILLLLVFISISIEIPLRSERFFLFECKKNLTCAKTEILDGDLLILMQETRDFLDGDRSEYDIVLPVSGEKRELFTGAEQKHMKDVRTVYRFIHYFTVFYCVCYALSMVFFIKRNSREYMLLLRKSVVLCLAAVLFMAAGFGIFFDESFTILHKLFFPMGNWQFDWSSSLLVKIFSNSYFTDYSLCVLSCTFAGLLVIYTVLRLNDIVGEKNERC